MFGHYDQHGHAEVRFDAARIPVSNVVGEEEAASPLLRPGSDRAASIIACARSAPPNVRWR